MHSAPTMPSATEQQLLDSVALRLLAPEQWPRCQELLAAHHYLGAPRPVGERLCYAITDAAGDWLGVLVFCAVGTLSAVEGRPAACTRAIAGSAGARSSAAAACR